MLLEDGPVSSKQILNEARDCGHAPATIRRAKKELRIEARKGTEKKAPWTWYMPVEMDTETHGNDLENAEEF